jgi:hypothetical protein
MDYSISVYIPFLLNLLLDLLRVEALQTIRLHLKVFIKVFQVSNEVMNGLRFLLSLSQRYLH